MPSNTFSFDFELPGGVCVCGTYSVEGGRVEQVKFDDGTALETAPGGWAIETAPSAFLKAMGNEVLQRIRSNPVCQFEMEQTRKAA